MLKSVRAHTHTHTQVWIAPPCTR